MQRQSRPRKKKLKKNFGQKPDNQLDAKVNEVAIMAEDDENFETDDGGQQILQSSPTFHQQNTVAFNPTGDFQNFQFYQGR